MGMRERLYGSYFNGALFTGCLIGLMCQSFGVFVVITVLLTLIDIHSGHIRLNPQHQQRKKLR